MAIEQIKTYNYKELLTLSAVQFEKACVFNKPEQVEGYSIYWIKEGKGVYNIDFKSYSFDGNILFFLSPGQVFSIESESIKEAYKLSFVKDFYCIQTHDKEIACNGVLFNNIYETPFVKLFDTDIKRLDFILENLIFEFESPEVAQYDMLQSYLKQFIIHSVRIKKEYQFQKQNFESELFKNFSLLVEQNFKTLHSVTDYANRLGLSPKSLTKHFNNVGVVTPSDFIKDRIILEAKRKLLYTNSSVKQIAYDLGFNDSAYFTRFFKKALSESPLQFKKTFKAQ
jgi:AraC-like DNA-binding protein